MRPSLGFLAYLSICLMVFAPLAAEPTAPDKIDGEIIAHQQIKQRVAEALRPELTAALVETGVNVHNLEAEGCALYVNQRLSESEMDDLAKRGIVVNRWVWVPPVPGRHPAGFHLATVDYDSLDTIRNDDRFVRLASTEFSSQPLNDVGGLMINSDDVRSGSGVVARDGTGVKIAVADSGLDVSHPDVPVPAEAFDMTDGTDPATWGTDVSNLVTYHGTHVTGTAVGNGQRSGGRYVGSAPGADLYFYKIGSDSSGSASSTDQIEAINRALAVGCDLFTMSYGGYRTYMDGSSADAQALDAAVAAGMACFISAGNEADDDRHDSLLVPPGTSSSSFGFTIDNSFGDSTYTPEQWIRVIWIDGQPGDLNLSLTCTNLGGGESLTQAFAGVSPRDTEAKRYVLIPSVPAGGSKTYNLVLTNAASGGQTPTVHCYRVSGRGTFDSADPFYTVKAPALADNAIAVGAWTQRTNWTDYQGNGWLFSSLTLDTLAPFSSRGPRIDGLMKPAFVAPGALTISTRDSGPLPGFPDHALVIHNTGANNGVLSESMYYGATGTSMSCPLAAGAAALVLETNPSLSATELKAVLQSTASAGGSPDNEVGAGLINVLAAVSQQEALPCCPATVTSFPYFEDFEAEPSCTSSCSTPCLLVGDWSNDTAADVIDWTSDAGGTPSPSTGPSVDHTLGTSSGMYLYTEASDVCNHRPASLLSPCFDLSSLIGPTLSFWYHMYGSAMGELRVEVSDDNCATWTIVWSRSGQDQLGQADPWKEVTVDLSTYVDEMIRIRIVGVTGDGFQSDMAIDDILIDSLCVPPTATVDNDGPICNGEGVQLTGGPDGMTSYAWTGPNGYTSDQQHPWVAPAETGEYCLTVTNEDGCASDPTCTTIGYLDVPADVDGDCDVDQDDYLLFKVCMYGRDVPLFPGCEHADLDNDLDGDQSDFGILQRCLSGADVPPDPQCAD